MKNLLCLTAFAMLTSCASPSDPKEVNGSQAISAEVPNLPSDFGRERQICFQEWRDIVAAWRESSGGFADTMQKTREQVLFDDSPFSAGVRFAWSNQPKTTKQWVGGKDWPVSEDAYRNVIKSTWGAFDKIVSHECDSVSWLGPIFWDEVRALDIGGVRWDVLTDMPSNIRKDPTSAGNWIMYNLFVRE